jgi:hypothetical protein
MKDINTHIEYNKQILNDPTVSPQRRRHTQDELSQLEVYKTNHPNEEKDPTSLELYCELNPDALECKVYDD